MVVVCIVGGIEVGERRNDGDTPACLNKGEDQSVLSLLNVEA